MKIRPIYFAYWIFLLSAACTPSVTSDMHDSPYSYSVHTHTLANGQTIAYQEQGAKGSGPSLVFLHGLGSYLPVWNNVLAQMEESQHCLAVDLPGFGQSPAGEGPESISQFAETVEAFVREKELSNVILVGHSMGAQISMRLALRQQIPIHAMALLAPAGIETFTAEEATQMKAATVPAAILSFDQTRIEQNFAINFANNQLPEDARFMYEDRLLLRSDSTNYAAFAQSFCNSVAAMLDGPVFGELSELNIPVEVLYGSQDLLIPNRYFHPEMTIEEVAKQAQENIVDSRVQLLPECGHFVPWEQPEAVSTAIQRLLIPASAMP